MTKPEPRVDSHHHLWDLDIRPQDWIDPQSMLAIHRSFRAADFEAVARPANVVASVLVQTVCVPEETPEMLLTAQASEVISGVVGWTDLEARDVADQLAALREGPGGRWLRGIRHQVQQESDPDWLARPAVRRGLQAVHDAGLSYDFVVRSSQLPAVARTAEALPEVNFVLDHAGKPPIAAAREPGSLERWHRDLRLLAPFPQLSCKLSGLVTEADWEHWTEDDLHPVVETLLEVFGPQRLMIGSDWPVNLLATRPPADQSDADQPEPYQQIWDSYEHLVSTLSPAERTALRSGTARRVYRLG
ncbi:amidohydrolase family protein [Psychromicrobium xiongbiense]|uniref:amidohydrolase family protein n=1 Tax=Psychromicrobium xiongbiense TaxID=3051184 RepID=UPI0025526B1B|nr:amidohydrolase family protein [Psychromicrobium sp. YIM S02556]